MILNWLLTYVVASFSVPLGFLIASKTKSEWKGSILPKLVSETMVLVAVGIALYVALGAEPLSLYTVLFGILVGYFARVGFEFLPAASLVYYLDAVSGSYFPVVLSSLWLVKGSGLKLRDMLFQWGLFVLVSVVFVTSGLFIFASMLPFIISFFSGLSIGQMVRSVDI
jgi:hypothetical protein